MEEFVKLHDIKNTDEFIGAWKAVNGSMFYNLRERYDVEVYASEKPEEVKDKQEGEPTEAEIQELFFKELYKALGFDKE